MPIQTVKLGFEARVAYIIDGHPLVLVYSVRKDWPELIQILNKGLRSITEQERTHILKKYLVSSPDEEPRSLNLTSEEQAWLEQNHTVRVRAADWPPYLIIRENEPPQGIAIEYLKLIGKRSGITFDFEVTDQPFAEFLESMQQHQGPDMTAAIIPTPEREQYLSFSVPYFFSPYVIFAREQDNLILDISGLAGKTLAVPRGFSLQKQLANDFPEIRLALFDSDEQSGPGSGGNRSDGCLYRQPDRGQPYRPQAGIFRAAALKWVLLVVGGTFGVVIFFTFWNRSLAKRIRSRTAELESSNQSLVTEVAERTKAEKALRESRNYFKNLTDSLPDAVFLVKMPERVIEWANDTYNVLGYEPGECVGKTTEFLYPDRKGFIEFGDKIQRAIAVGDDIFTSNRS